jgi:hypothetical protein
MTRANPRWDTIAGIAFGLGVSLDDIASQCGYPTTRKGTNEDVSPRVASQIAIAQEHLKKAARAQDTIAEIVAAGSRARSAKR